jgi:acyl-CoA-binding protein
MDLADLALILEGVDAESITSDSPQFKEAASRVSALHGLDNETQLQLYGLYKQSIIGNVNTSKPWAIDVVGSAKWKSWKSFEGFPKESAARAYVYVVSNLLPSPLASGGNGRSSSGSGGEDVKDERPRSRSGAGAGQDSIFDGMGVTISTLHAQQEQESAKTAKTWKESESLMEAVVDGDVEKVLQILDNPEGCEINMRNDAGLTPLHFAVDRGNAELVKILLDRKADQTLKDNDDQTPLEIAKICEYDEIVEILASHKI